MPANGERAAAPFRHEALLYAGLDEFVEATVPFLREAVAEGEPALVVVDQAKIAALREALGPEADMVHFADMAEVGRNPARIIPAWYRFVDEHNGGRRRFRGVGELIHPQRTSAELVECQLHERLLNLAHGGGPDWWLLCPYDVSALPPAVVDEAERAHPFVTEVDRKATRESDLWWPDGRTGLPPMQPLEDAAPGAARMIFGADGSVEAVRPFVAAIAEAAGMRTGRIDDLVLAVTELVANSIRHGDGSGVLLVWVDGEALLCEVRDHGHFDPPPLVGRQLPPATSLGGRGLWLVNQLCDLLQIRSGSGGTVMRIHMDLDG